MVWLGVAAASAGCGDGARIVLGQGQPADGGTPDAGLGPFGPPVVVDELGATGANDFKETLTADLLEVYFCSDRPGGPGNQDVWVATRASASDPWGAPTCVTEVSSTSMETGSAVSPDGLTLWVGSSRPGGLGGMDVWVSTRPDRISAWSAPVDATDLSTTGNEFPRPLGQGELAMPLSVRAPPNNKYETFMALRPAIDAAWAPSTRVTEIDMSAINTDAFLTDDGLTLYLSSDRLVAGDQDLYVATRATTTSPFTSAVAIAELNTAGFQERDPWLTPDGRTIYFSSDRGGTLKIYRATR